MLASFDRILISTRPSPRTSGERRTPQLSCPATDWRRLHVPGVSGFGADTAASAWPAPFHACRCCGFPSQIKASRLTMWVSIIDSSGLESRLDILTINFRFIYRCRGAPCGQFQFFIYTQDAGCVMPGQDDVTGRPGNSIPNVSPICPQVWCRFCTSNPHVVHSKADDEFFRSSAGPGPVAGLPAAQLAGDPSSWLPLSYPVFSAGRIRMSSRSGSGGKASSAASSVRPGLPGIAVILLSASGRPWRLRRPC